MAHWTDPRPTARHRLALGAAGVALAALLLSACGGSSSGSSAASTFSAPAPSSAAASSSSGGGSSQATTITATEAEFSVSIPTKTVAAGPYLVKVDNNGRATHDLVVERDGAKVASTDSIAPGSSASLSVTLKPGDYVFYCSIGNHRAMGMQVTVHVS